MRNEETLIPYHTSDLTGKRVLVFAPHPDDETIGCGGSLVRHSMAGDPVKIVFLTNGAKGDTSGKINREEYVKLRKAEAVAACACLGVTDLEFWGYEDRGLAGSRGALGRMLDLLEGFRPQIVYAPSPLEFHPDHRAACFLLCDAIKNCHFEFEVAFYELGQPLRVNRLVDITGVSGQKALAVDAYKSQLKERAYGDISLALDRYRSLTLAEDTIYAEGFSLWGTEIIRKIGPFSILFQQVERLMPGKGEAGPLVSIIVRTKDRPAQLANALKSIAGQTYANLEIVVVNDGGQDVKDVVIGFNGAVPVTYIAHEENRGRAAAANSGLKAAKGIYLNFLDDDDVFYPDHVETLVSCLQGRDEKVAYSNALSVYFYGPPDSDQSRIKEELIFNLDFNPDILLFQNYIPTMTVLFSREVLLASEGFCEEMDLFEDWDFWIRVSRHFSFHHIDKVTAEYRFYGVTTDEESHRKKYRYDEALAMVFEKNRSLLNGKAWVKFLNEGSMGRFRGEVQTRRANLAQLENNLSGCQDRIRTLEENIKSHQEMIRQKAEGMHKLKEQYDDLLIRNTDLNQHYTETLKSLDRVRKHPAYGVYKKIKNLMQR